MIDNASLFWAEEVAWSLCSFSGCNLPPKEPMQAPSFAPGGLHRKTITDLILASDLGKYKSVVCIAAL
jgi:hypothetical protein